MMKAAGSPSNLRNLAEVQVIRLQINPEILSNFIMDSFFSGDAGLPFYACCSTVKYATPKISV